MKGGMSLQFLATEVVRVRESKLDYLIPSSEMRLETIADGAVNVPRVSFGVPAGTEQYSLSDVARRQLADKLRIPFAYFERMQNEKPKLLDENVNTWLRADNEARLVRVLDGNVRALLSKRYRRIDNWQVAEWVLPMLNELQDSRVESCSISPKRMYIKVVTPRVSEEVVPGDIVQAGVVVSNSEVGHGRLLVQPMVFRLVCKNGLIASDQTMRRAHIGRVLEPDDDGVTVFQDDTLRADDRAFMLKVRDVVRDAVSEATLKVTVDRLRRSVGVRIEGNPIGSIRLLADRYCIDELEQGGILRHLITGADLSGYGLINAVTGYSQEVADYERATELESLGGRLLDLSEDGWRELVTAE